MISLTKYAVCPKCESEQTKAVKLILSNGRYVQQKKCELCKTRFSIDVTGEIYNLMEMKAAA